MARLARVVIPDLPHHVTQRGNRRETVFFKSEDYQAYLDLLGQSAEASGAVILAYCLMPNHVHLIVVPKDADGLRATIAPTHRAYARRVNARNMWTGHLWQGRFASVAMDEEHLFHALLYVTLNPVRAGLVEKADEWQWSSVHAHLSGQDNGLVTVQPVLDRVGDFGRFLRTNVDDEMYEALRKSETVGRPLGNDEFLLRLEDELGRPLKKQKPGPRGKGGGLALSLNHGKENCRGNQGTNRLRASRPTKQQICS